MIFDGHDVNRAARLGDRQQHNNRDTCFYKLEELMIRQWRYNPDRFTEKSHLPLIRLCVQTFSFPPRVVFNCQLTEGISQLQEQTASETQNERVRAVLTVVAESHLQPLLITG